MNSGVQDFRLCKSKRLPFRACPIDAREARVTFADRHGSRLADPREPESRHDDLEESLSEAGPSGWNGVSLAIGLFIVAAGVMWAAMLLQLLTTAYENLLALMDWQMWLKH